MKLSIIVLITAFVTGCASASKTYGPDGREAYSLNCSGTARNWGMCYEKAGELCKERGYDILTKSGDQGAMVTGNNSGFYGTSTFSRTMTISCK